VFRLEIVPPIILGDSTSENSLSQALLRYLVYSADITWKQADTAIGVH
jgi:hypothetical protein